MNSKVKLRFMERRLRSHAAMRSKCLSCFFSFLFLLFTYSVYHTHDKGQSFSSVFHQDTLLPSKENSSLKLVDLKSQLPTDVSKFKQVAPVYGFVLLNGYRIGKYSFAAVGIGGLRLRDTRHLGPCYHLPPGRSRPVIHGNASVFYPGEHHDLTYEGIVVHCHFPKKTSVDKGGDVYLAVDTDDLLIYSEEKRSEPVEDPKGPFKHKVTYCSPPIYGSVETPRIYEWIEYHLRIGMDHLIMYDAGGVDDELAEVFAPYIQKGIMELVNSRNTLLYDTWLYTQVALMNDCAYRTRYTSKWAMFMDFDEYWIAKEIHTKISSLLDNYDGKPFVTFGSLWWSVSYCEPSQGLGEWPVERMLHHWPKIYCQSPKRFPNKELCLDYWGHRKYAVNPREVTALQIHRPEVPLENGVNLDTGVARMNHFQGLIRKNATICQTIVVPENKPEWWVSDNNIAQVVKHARVGERVVNI